MEIEQNQNPPVNNRKQYFINIFSYSKIDRPEIFVEIFRSAHLRALFPRGKAWKNACAYPGYEQAMERVEEDEPSRA